MSHQITVPLLDLKAQYAPIRDEITAAIHEVIEAQWFILGPEVQGLEEDVASYLGAANAVGCASGSDAILLALMALGVEAGDEVICPAYTFFSTAGSIHRLGARPVFVDIDPVNYNVSPASVRAAAARCTRLKAIMPVHLFGRVAPMDEMLALGEELGVPVIEDAAQAIGARDERGRAAGTIGSIGCFSFFPSKNLGAFGDAGLCTSADETLADSMSMLRVHGGHMRYYHKVVGFNSRLDALQAAVLRVKLRHLDGWTAGRQSNAAWYDRAFAEAGAVTSAVLLDDPAALPLRTPDPVDPAGAARHIYNQYVIRVPAEIRDTVREGLRERNIGNEVYYPVPLHLQERFASLGGAEGDLPHSERAARETIALPIYPELTDAQREHVATSVISLVNAHATVGA